MKYSGERLVRDDAVLHPLHVENLARFDYFQKKVSGNNILDLGCGVGEGSNYLSLCNENWIINGVDLSFEAVNNGRMFSTSGRVIYSCMDVTSLAFPNEIFDAIISVEVIEHIVDVNKYLLEAHRVLKQGGIFFLTTPNRLISSPTPKSLWPDHVIEYNSKELKELILSIFQNCEILGESIPVYENNVFRKVVHNLAPLIKPILPKWLRIRALHLLQYIIKKDIMMTDVQFSNSSVDSKPTLIAICFK